jgi:hypothetical protein
MDLKKELTTAGVEPSGPCSAYPKERHEKLVAQHRASQGKPAVKASVGQMAKGLARTAGQAIRFGKVSAEVREERYDTCKACPAFNPDSKRCSECGCFMEAKTWIGGDAKKLCPLKKWSR